MLQTSAIATRPASAATILDQVGRWTLASVGARDIVDLGDGVHFFFGRGRSRKMVIKLSALDLYAVEVVRFNRRDFSFVSEQFIENVYADQVGEVVARFASEAAR